LFHHCSPLLYFYASAKIEIFFNKMQEKKRADEKKPIA